MQASRYSPPQDSFSMKPDSGALAITLLLTLWRRLRCPKCRQPHTPCCCQLQTRNPAAYHIFAPSSWYSVPARIHERCREYSISWAIRAYKLVCLPGVTLEKDQETWLLACNSAWFWGACYSAIPCRLGCSFMTWYFYRELTFEALVRGGGFVNKRLSNFGIRKIVLPRFLTVNGDQGFFSKKPEDDIRSWAWKVWSLCEHSWRYCRRTQPLVRAGLNHSARSWQKLKDRPLSCYSASQSGRMSAGRWQWIVSAWCRGNNIAMTRTLRWRATPGRWQLSPGGRDASLPRWWWSQQGPGHQYWPWLVCNELSLWLNWRWQGLSYNCLPSNLSKLVDQWQNPLTNLSSNR